MTVDPEVLRAAREGNRRAVIEVLAAQYPLCHRIAHAICGRQDVADGVVSFVMKQSFHVVKTWDDEEAPQRWFRHHTLLTARRAEKWKPEPDSDTLLNSAARSKPEASYGTFLAALRRLSRQQVEAFLLMHGERLDVRSVAVAMDCSTRAAQMHLEVADKRLRLLAGDDFDRLLEALRQAYESLVPSTDLALDRVRTEARRYWWPRRIRKIARIVALLALIAGSVYLGMRYRTQIASLVTSMFSPPVMQPATEPAAP